MEAEYIALLKAMRNVLPFVSLMKKIYFVLELQGDTPKVLCSIFLKPVTVNEDSPGAIILVVAPQMKPRAKHIAIKYQYF